jgi:hypothetical protein
MFFHHPKSADSTTERHVTQRAILKWSTVSSANGCTETLGFGTPALPARPRYDRLLARLRMIAVITEREAARRILAHLGLPTEPPPLARARDPTEEDIDDEVAALSALRATGHPAAEVGLALLRLALDIAARSSSRADEVNRGCYRSTSCRRGQ